MEREGHCKQILLACVGSASSRWTTLGLPWPKAAYNSRVNTAQVPGCSARALSQMGPAFCALPRSKLLRQLGAWQVQGPRWVMHLMHLPGLSHSVSHVCCEGTVPGVLCFSSGELISGCDTTGKCELCRIPGRCG